MTPQEVVWFFNHKYGEKAYIVETLEELLIFTRKSKWKIFKKDYSRFNKYTLYHYNSCENEHFHKQMSGYTLPFLTYCACFHDETDFVTRSTWDEFQHLWEMYLLGREIEERMLKWDWLCGKELDYA